MIGIPSRDYVISNEKVLNETYSIIFKDKNYDCYEINEKIHFGNLQEKEIGYVFNSLSKQYTKRVEIQKNKGNVKQAKKIQKEKNLIEQLCKTAKVEAENKNESIFSLVDVANSQIIKVLSEGTSVSVNRNDLKLVVKYPIKIGSIKIELNKGVYLLDASPYEVVLGKLPIGEYEIKLTPYTKDKGLGFPGREISFKFRVVDTSVNTESPVKPLPTPDTNILSYKLTVSKKGSGKVSGNGISCGTECSKSYVKGTSVVLSAFASEGYLFSGWGGDCSGNSCSIILNSNKTVVANFTQTGRLAAPNIKNPNTRIVNGKIRVEWANVTGASGYLIGAVDQTNPAKDLDLLYEENYTNTTYDLSVSDAKKYRFWVRARKATYDRNDNSTFSEVSDVIFDAHASPTPTPTPTLTPTSSPTLPPPATPTPPASCNGYYAEGCNGTNLTLNIKKQGNGTVSGTGINCGADCSETFTSTTTVNLIAQPASGWVFSGWGGACSGLSCSIQVNRTKEVVANFSIAGGIAAPVIQSFSYKSDLDQKVEIKWSAVEGAAGYLIRVKDLTQPSAIYNGYSANGHYVYVDAYPTSRDTYYSASSPSFKFPITDAHKYEFWVHAKKSSFDYSVGTSYSAQALISFTAQANSAINGACGTNAKVYLTTENQFSGNFCAKGTASPVSVNFPAAGQSVSWSCNGNDGGTSTNCSASRVPVGSCGLVPNGTIERRIMNLTSEVPTGQSCQSEQQTRSCSNGNFTNWSGTYQFDFCEPDGGVNYCPSGTTDKITQYGITWYFDRAYPCGRFANGDYWVTPIQGVNENKVKITNIDPKTGDGGVNYSNGSMINFMPAETQGLYLNGDDKNPENLPKYDLTKNISLQLPIKVASGSSVYSTMNNPHTWKGHVNKDGNYVLDPEAEKTWFKETAVLTVLGSAPAAGSFRPPYAGSDKTIKPNWKVSELHYSALRSLTIPVPSNAPSMSWLEKATKRPLIEVAAGHVNSNFKAAWAETKSGGYTRRTYGREVGQIVGGAGLMLNSNLSNKQKEKLAIHMVQWGIDIYGLLQNGMVWAPNGGHNLGRLLPLFIAGRLLNDSDLNNKAKNGSPFQDLTFHFFISKKDVDTARSPGRVPYTDEMIGLPEYGWSGHPDNSSAWEGGSGYRFINGAGGAGTVATILLMGGRAQVNHEAYFRYFIERYYPKYRPAPNLNGPYSGDGNGIEFFVRDMWDNHISNK